MIDLDLLEASVRIEIMHLQQYIQQFGGIDDRQIEEASLRLQSIRESDASESMLFLMTGKTQQTFSIVAEYLAVLACVPGGVKFAGRHFCVNE